MGSDLQLTSKFAVLRQIWREIDVIMRVTSEITCILTSLILGKATLTSLVWITSVCSDACTPVVVVDRQSYIL